VHRLAGDGFPTDPRPSWQMLELPHGGYAVQQADRLMVQQPGPQGGRWLSIPRQRSPMTITRSGELIATADDPARQTLVFQRWGTENFLNASAEADVQDLPVEMVREAPDGSIWCVGKGILLRWRYEAPTWTAMAGLPPPQGLDAAGRAWFADGDAVWVAHDGQFDQIPEAHGPLRFDHGDVWANTPDGFLRIHGNDRQVVTHAVAGLDRLRTVMSDARGVRWFVGAGLDGATALRSFDGTTWRTPSPALPEGYDVTMIEPDPSDGMWLTLRQRTTARWVIGRLTGNALSIVASENLPQLQMPRLPW